MRFRLPLDGDAQSTVLDHAAVAPLGLVPISGQISVSIQLKPDDYPPVVMLEDLPITVRDVGGQGYDGIAGRDFLKDCVLSLDVNDYTLAF